MGAVLEAIKRKTLIGAAIGAVLGLLLGLAIGWWWWPVTWTSSTPANLRVDFQSDYLVWVAEQYVTTGDLESAQARLGVEFWKEGQLSQTLERLAEERGGEEATRLRALARALTAPEPVPEERGLLTALRPLLPVCGIGLLALAAVGGGVAIFALWRSRAAKPIPAKPIRPLGVRPAEPVSWGAEGPPLAQFVTSYGLGDDHYDPSFSIELEGGEFLGECGVGISEIIGVGPPDRVTAFEVWLFDKNDIRTVTKVLMSEYAYNDEALRARLAPKGEPVLAGEGRDVGLETATLRVRARVVEMDYGVGNLPPHSFFERLTMELAAWVKPARESGLSADDLLSPPTL